jgi:hypothetical protein
MYNLSLEGKTPLMGELTLLRSCLASNTIYLMSIIKFTKWAVEAITRVWGISSRTIRRMDIT